MKKSIYAISAAVLLCVGLMSCKESLSPIAFEAFEIMDGGNYMIEIDIPKGDGEREKNVTEGIRDIIAHSELGEKVGAPIEGTLQEVMEDYHERYNKYAQDNADGPRTPMCNLEIKSSFQNEACVTFIVFDDIHFSGAPDYYKSIVRISDGRMMSQQELVNISMPDADKLIKKYNQNDDIPVYLEDGYWFSPSSGDSCHVMWAYSRIGWGEATIPLSDMDPYLTEEGKKLFSAKVLETPVEDDEQISSDADDAAIHGELGIFGLRGAVKEFTWSNGEESWTYGFDQAGMWISSKNCQSPADCQAVERDDQGRVTKMGDPYDECYETFAYNDDGLIEKHVMKDIDGYMLETNSFYDSQLDCTKEVNVVGDPLTGSGEFTTTFTILDRDSHGNWTKRKNQEGKTETREIIYY